MKQNGKAKCIFSLILIVMPIFQVARAQWESIGPTKGGFVHDICALGSYVFICDDENGVFRSTDNGATWDAVNTGLTNKYMRCLAVKGNYIFAGGEKRYDDEAGGFFFFSSDSGTTWKDVSSGFPELQYWTDIDAIEVCGNSIYAVMYNGNSVLRSIDNGTTWTRVDSGLVYPFETLLHNGSSREITEVAVSGDTVFAASGQDLFISYDSAASWTALVTGRFNGGMVTSLAVSGNSLYAGTHMGYYKSTDGGVNWTAGNLKLANLFIRKLVCKGDTIFAADESDGGFGPPQLYRSVDNGKNWKSVKKLNGHVASLYVRGDNVFVGCNDSLYRSTDNGITWSTILAGKEVLCIAAIGDTVLLQNYMDDIYRSTDNGNSWRTYTDFPDNHISSLAVSKEFVYAGTIERIFRSTDNGLSWAAVNSENTKIFASELAVKGNLIVAGGDCGPVTISNDNGHNWTTVSLSSIATINSIAIIGEVIFVGTSDGVSLLTNNGTGWSVTNTTVSAGEYNHMLYSMAINETDVFIGTYRGSVWRCPLSKLPLTVKSPEYPSSTPHGLKIMSPGTMRTSAQITFSLSHRQQVALTIFNLSGAVVQSFPGSYFESGVHTIKWDTRLITPGCYLIKIQAGSKNYAKRITLIR